jgi:hypothetical protein
VQNTNPSIHPPSGAHQPQTGAHAQGRTAEEIVPLLQTISPMCRLN